jgi:hypothetical protein
MEAVAGQVRVALCLFSHFMASSALSFAALLLLHHGAAHESMVSSFYFIFLILSHARQG